jgi:CheY-like chemotaxis protein
MEVFSTERKTILLVEDDDTSYQYFRIVCSKNNFNIMRAEDGLAAVEICRNHDINLIIMDIHLPEMDGLEATKMIREFNNSLPIVAQTASPSSFIEEAAHTAGCNKIIFKPIDDCTLLSIIDEYLKN